MTMMKYKVLTHTRTVTDTSIIHHTDAVAMFPYLTAAVDYAKALPAHTTVIYAADGGIVWRKETN